MNTLGKMTVMIVLCTLSLFGDHKAYVEYNHLTSGDEAVFAIKAWGGEVDFPKIDMIEGYQVTGKSTNTHISYVGGEKHKTYVRKYRFHPLKSLTIPSYTLRVGGKTEQTEPIKLTVTPDPSEVNGSLLFDYTIDKKSAYVSEPIRLTYTFKHKDRVKISDASFKSPKFEGFWVKKLKGVKNRLDTKSGYRIYELNYLLFPQKSGIVRIAPAGMDVGVMRPRQRHRYYFRSIRRKYLQTQVCDLNISPLPEGAKLYGDFNFHVVADKNSTKVNEPVNVTVTITGVGNVDEIDAFEISVKDAEVYASEPDRSMVFKDGKAVILFKQKFALVSDRNFTIPPLSFDFLDSKTKEVKHLTSKPIAVEVTGTQSSTSDRLVKATPQIQKIQRSTPLSLSRQFAIFLGGVGIGMLLFWLFGRLRSLRAEKSAVQKPIQTRIRHAKDNKALLQLLLPFCDRSAQIKEIVEKLEANLYEGASHRIDRKALAKKIETLLVSDEENDRERELIG